MIFNIFPKGIIWVKGHSRLKKIKLYKGKGNFWKISVHFPLCREYYCMRTCSFFWLKLFLRILIISITNYMIVINFSFKLTPFFYYYHFEPDSGLEIPIRLRFKSDWPPTPDGLQMPTSIGGLDLLWSDAAASVTGSPWLYHFKMTGETEITQAK